MDGTNNFRLWVFALVLVLFQYLISDEGKRSMNGGVWHALVTACSIGCVLLAWPYVKENALKVWHGEACLWPVAILVVSALAIMAMTWLATYSHMASLPSEQSDNAGKLGLQQKLEADLVTAKQQAEIERKATQGVVAKATELNETIEALTVERDNLQAKVNKQATELDKRDSEAERLREARTQLLAKVESAPTYTDFTSENSLAWISSARLLVDSLVSVPKRNQFRSHMPNANLENFQMSVESLRSIAVTLSANDLSN